MPPKRKKEEVDDDAGEAGEVTSKVKSKAVKIATAAEIERDALIARAKDGDQWRTPAGDRTDGRFYARFVKMGQGDCIVMTTPGGKVVLVDCGSLDSDDLGDLARKQFAYNSLFVDRFLGKNPYIDVLILTHPDADHWNKVGPVLSLHGDAVSVGTIYHSRDLAEYGKSARDWILQTLDEGGIEYWVKFNKGAALQGTGVTGEISLAGRTWKDKKYTTTELTTTAAKGVNVLDGNGGIRIVDEPDCRISILASDVAADYVGDNDTGKFANRGSVVTLVELWPDAEGKNPKQRLLLCGDATRSTEAYLMDKGTYAAKNKIRLANVDVVQVGHHGSSLTSSGEKFVELVNPKSRALISAGKVGVVEHHLPNREVIESYGEAFDKATVTAPPHKIWWWDLKESTTTSVEKTLETPIYITGSEMSDPWNESNLDIVWTKLA